MLLTVNCVLIRRHREVKLLLRWDVFEGSNKVRSALPNGQGKMSRKVKHVWTLQLTWD